MSLSREFLLKNLRGSLNRAESGHCEGGCIVSAAGHAGKMACVRVKDAGFDWGFFSYCESAIEIDRRRGLTVKVIKTIGDDFKP